MTVGVEDNSVYYDYYQDYSSAYEDPRVLSFIEEHDTLVDSFSKRSKNIASQKTLLASCVLVTECMLGESTQNINT